MTDGSTPAVILSTRPLGEADLLVVLLTPELGKIRAAARNARSSKRRFAGGLPGGALGQATLVRRSAQGLWRLDRFQSIRDLGIIGRDLTRFAYVAYVCELTDALVSEPEPDPGRFAALASTLEQLLDPSAAPQPALLRRYELCLLYGLGLLPTLDSCCVCGQPVAPTAMGPEDPSEIAFEPERGGALCGLHAGGAARLPVAIAAVASALLDETTAADALARLTEASPTVRRGLRDLTAALVRAQLRRPLRSLEFFAHLVPSRAADP